MRRRKVNVDDGGLREILKRGHGVTLVLGAGISKPRGVPLWPDLLQGVWKRVFRDDPWGRRKGFLERAKDACRRAGLPPDDIERLRYEQHPLEIQFAFEEVYDSLRWDPDRARMLRALKLPQRSAEARRKASREEWVAQVFTEVLRRELYRGVPRLRAGQKIKPDSLGVVARSIRFHARLQPHQRVIRQVITFNADDLLEREVNHGYRHNFAMPIFRSSGLGPLPDGHAIPIFHVHGFIPLHRRAYPVVFEDGSSTPEMEAPDDALIFTDEQYWRSAAAPNGFASRVFTRALMGSCVFLGLSMTDLNLIRWLAVDAVPRYEDMRRLTSDWDLYEAEHNIVENSQRHYWIRTQRLARDRDGRWREPDVLASQLGRRAVECIEIESWGKPFIDWWNLTFSRGLGAARKIRRRSARRSK